MKSRDDSGLAILYTNSISHELEILSDCNALSHIGALIIEPGKRLICALLIFWTLTSLDPIICNLTLTNLNLHNVIYMIFNDIVVLHYIMSSFFKITGMFPIHCLVKNHNTFDL